MIHCISWEGFLGYFCIVLAQVHSAGISLPPKTLIMEQSAAETHIDVLPFKRK